MRTMIKENVFEELARIARTMENDGERIHPLLSKYIFKSVIEGTALQSEVHTLNIKLKGSELAECPRFRDMQANDYGYLLCPITGTLDAYE